MNDDTTTCVLTTSSNDVFTAIEFRATVFRGNAGGASGQLDVQGATESGLQLSHQLSSTTERVNYMDFIAQELTRLNITYSSGEEELSFFMRLNGKFSKSMEYNYVRRIDSQMKKRLL